MQFEFQNPTRLIFGAGKLARLGEVVSAYGKRALLVTGGGSVKRNGTFDRYAADTLRIAGRDGKLGGRPPMSADDITAVLRTVL